MTGSLPVQDSAAAPLTGCRQLLQVGAADWSSSSGLLQCWQRTADDLPWQAVGPAIAVSLGRHGLRWGLGLHGPAPDGGLPAKVEGDGCTPAGVFRLVGLFGEAAADSAWARGLRLPYRATSPTLLAIDDPASRHYNRLVDLAERPSVDWRSAETMRRDDERYVLGALIGHNPAQRPGAGSCIFLHVWGGPGVPTAGCTAAARDEVERLCAWLDAAARPCLVQLPHAAYLCLAAPWGLPPIVAGG